MSSNKKAILYPNKENDTDCLMARQTAELLKKNGWLTDICSFPEEPDLTGAGMLITFGGDGTILRAARVAAPAGVPILGVNLGGKGFIAELEPGEIKLIEKAAAGEYDIEARMMIDIEILRDGKTLRQDYALNDAVIKGENKVIEMTVFADGQKITNFAGDGTIIATPTGSTAYSMSAGGPIVEPSAKNIIVTPICAHILEAKSFVLTASRVITVRIENKKDIPVYISIDGGDHMSIQREDIIEVTKSDKSAQLMHLSGKSFYHRLSAKLISRMNYS